MSRTLLNTVEWAVRINVFLKLGTYGLGKILNGQFYTKNNIPESIGSIPLSETESYNLAWTFFGHSRGYILFIGISQLLGAVLFLIPRTKLIGGSILIPILLNIIVVDYFFGVAYGALFSACFYVASIAWVFYLERSCVRAVVAQLLVRKPKTSKKSGATMAIYISGIVLVVGAIFFIEYVGIGLFGYEDR
ncbi:hypothetical protein G5B37_13775 [Rasiella rasia]|uniref:Uncharacterized protein n=1 Tax=Rasiella rasia TaxID=2744027 RepID=A0A6G6GQ46_9FLAO|nr:hypothetical protein [Rasiella rasia]QIE60594.1 hypothetical protein G5B37_13775 [Rasiella rasia]